MIILNLPIIGRTSIIPLYGSLPLRLKAIGREELANELHKLYFEIEDIDTEELVELRTFIKEGE